MRMIDADALIAETMKNRCADCDRRKGIKQGKTTFVYDFGEAPCRACDVGDMIDTLDEATTISGWISVKDRLPESSGIKVIVSAKTTPESVLQTKAVFVAFLGYGDGKWYTPDVDFMESTKTGNDNVHPVWEITHWMFLPEPPKEAKGDEDD